MQPERKAQELAEQRSWTSACHSIIYELQDEIKRAMTGLLEPIIKETYQGRAEVLETYRIPKVGTITGCRRDGWVDQARFRSTVTARQHRRVQGQGQLVAARQRRCQPGKQQLECGISIANFGDIKAQGVTEAFVTERESRLKRWRGECRRSLVLEVLSPRNFWVKVPPVDGSAGLPTPTDRPILQLSRRQQYPSRHITKRGRA